MALGAALGVYVGEFVTHSWDLVVAIGLTDLLSGDLGILALAMVTAHILPWSRHGVDVPAIQ